MEENTFQNEINLDEISNGIRQAKEEIKKIIVGQDQLIDLLIAAMLANGHVLLEGFPGLAKTLSAKLMAKTVDAHFSRIQFTPDLMPSDVSGSSIYNFNSSEFDFKAGPIFSNIVLIDEINRAPAKTQAALFEVMEERQLTIDGSTYIMDEPFMIIATQNPIDMEGTYSLPEAQLDRFLFKVQVPYPNLEEETSIIKNYHQDHDRNDLKEVEPVLSKEQVQSYKSIVNKVRVDDKLIEYIAKLVQATRNHKNIYLGASPRASLSLLSGSKAIAVIRGRDFVIPEDINYVGHAVLAHRIIVTPENEMEGGTAESVIESVINQIEIPR